MPKLAPFDQAAGLRRLLGHSGLRAITVMSGSPGAGKTVASVNLASALARAGADVLLFDQSPGEVAVNTNERCSESCHAVHLRQGAVARLGLRARATLADAGHFCVDDLVLEHEVGMRVLPVGGGFEQFARYSSADVARLEAGFVGLACAVDTVLIDTEPSDDPARLPLGLASADILVVVTPDAEAIKDAYALVKRLVQRFGKRQFLLLVNRATNPAQADAVAGNFANAARRFLNARVECVGAIPEDLRILDSDILQQSVVEAFPVAASAPHFRRLAERLAGSTSQTGVANLSVLMQRVLHGSRLLPSHARG